MKTQTKRGDTLFKELRTASSRIPGDNTTVYKTMKTPRLTKVFINGIEYKREDLKSILLSVLKLKFGETVKINGCSHSTDEVAEELCHTLDKLGDKLVDTIRYEHIIELVEMIGFGNKFWDGIEFITYEVFLKENENGVQVAIPEYAETAKKLLEILEINTNLDPANFQDYKEEGFETIEDAMNTELILTLDDRWRHGTREERGTIYWFISNYFARESKYTLKEREKLEYRNINCLT